ncbi:hypothetical protein BBI01_05545 [Chryseobacterium artocarpi]|uniref:Uncharacterized protein n=1 Tax=Chryseobacterium artocarpi TaxID=1414727 RepID=A0A1B8ZX26_9FLAO|nr:hypothetical protein BBI01_05545 [Chryseobacterium artocarpi]
MDNFFIWIECSTKVKIVEERWVIMLFFRFWLKPLTFLNIKSGLKPASIEFYPISRMFILLNFIHRKIKQFGEILTK